MSRSSVSKKLRDFQLAPEVVPILEGSCARLKRLLKLCDQQIDAIEQDTNTPSQNRTKEVQILVRTVLNLQKDLLKYTKALHPDIPLKQQAQTTSTIRKEDMEVLSDEQLREITAYYLLDEDERDIDIDELIDTMLDRDRTPQKTTSTPAISTVEISNQPSPTPKTVPARLKVQSKQVDDEKSRQSGINHQGGIRSDPRDQRNHEYGPENPP